MIYLMDFAFSNLQHILLLKNVLAIKPIYSYLVLVLLMYVFTYVLKWNSYQMFGMLLEWYFYVGEPEVVLKQ